MTGLQHVLAKAILSMGGVGFSPIMPGTVGSLLSLFILLILRYFLPPTFGGGSHLNILVLFVLVLMTAVLGTRLIRLVVPADEHDASWIVLDEFVGMSIALLPMFLMETVQLLVIVVGFLLFRLFDMWKPFGIRIIDRMKTPASIMWDDVAAGALALLGQFFIAQYLVSKLNG